MKWMQIKYAFIKTSGKQILMVFKKKSNENQFSKRPSAKVVLVYFYIIKTI